MIRRIVTRPSHLYVSSNNQDIDLTCLNSYGSFFVPHTFITVPKIKRTNPELCLVCFKYHPLKYCGKFRKMTGPQRVYAVQVHSYCQNCLSRAHLIELCTSQKGCQLCGERHHTMIHPEPLDSQCALSPMDPDIIVHQWLEACFNADAVVSSTSSSPLIHQGPCQPLQRSPTKRKQSQRLSQPQRQKPKRQRAQQHFRNSHVRQRLSAQLVDPNRRQSWPQISLPESPILVGIENNSSNPNTPGFMHQVVTALEQFTGACKTPAMQRRASTCSRSIKSHRL